MNDNQPIDKADFVAADTKLKRAKACPFCGSRDLYLTAEFTVLCDDCGTTGPAGETKAGKVSYVTAVRKWNTRKAA